ncbi:protein odr-4 homolog [Megalobrama amblycephala]|uniref:protein odr-4 homolog n=1 Tax=Megalobrama amblycephala TaxID=75352 RepID=UPI002013ECDB|nr:protein odr-4 homolog [Megalobrama amblycephala]XP_048018222.1 protein odr-4 homolog [Megalobrama amblycephala]XP_048018223.1 protein odr-4 homolog [Megalobrama amblycephala]
MGRSYIVDEAVAKYLGGLQADPGSCATGLLAGQSSPQREFVVLAVQTPHRESEGQLKSSRGGSPLDDIDVEWVTEHARQVSRMLPGGLCILGLFLVTPPELSKDAQNTLKRLIFAMDKCIGKGRLWELTEEDVTDRVTLHICSKTKKTVCKTLDVKDPKSSAKPADWKYQTDVSSSWPMLTCSVEVDLPIPLTGSSDNTDKCMKDGLRRWAKQIEAGNCLISGRQALDDSELISGQKKNIKTAHRQTLPARILVSDEQPELDERCSALVQLCSGSIRVRGVVHCRAYIHNNKPKARHAAQAIKRDIINTVSSRVEMFLEDLLISEGSHKGLCTGQQALPRRVFAPMPFSGLSVCDYMFPDESTADVAERLKEMLDWETPEEDIDISLEKNQLFSPELEIIDGHDSSKHVISEEVENSKIQKAPHYYTGVAVAATIALLATATSLLYLSE